MNTQNNMSNNQSTAAANVAPIKAAVEAKLSPMQELKADFEKSGKLVYFPGEDMTVLQELLSNAAENGITFKDWTNKAPETFVGCALVMTKDETDVRLIAFPDKATALADPIVQDALYRRYVNLLVRTARDGESSEGQFITPSGALSVPFDNDAFAFQSKAWVAILQDRGLKSIQVRSLKLALQNAAFAKSSFPRFSEWENLIQFMAANAEKHGYSTSLFAHFAATRDAKKDEGANVSFGDVSLEQLLGEADENDDSEAKGE